MAQTSASHECYLRPFAARLDCPILSIDYTLSPSPFGGQHMDRAASWQSGYSNALDDVFHAYKWALNTLSSSAATDAKADANDEGRCENCANAEQLRDCLGWSGERVVLLGDSAGGNLCLALALRCIAEGVRVPDGLVLAYPCSLVSVAPSPSRLLSMFDPLLPAGALAKCFTAYLGLDNFARALPGDRELVDTEKLACARRAREEAASEELELVHVYDRSVHDWFALFEGLRSLSRCKAETPAEWAAAAADVSQQPRWVELLRKYSSMNLSAKAASTASPSQSTASGQLKRNDEPADGAGELSTTTTTSSSLAAGMRCRSDPNLSTSYREACELGLGRDAAAQLAGSSTRSLDRDSQSSETPDDDERKDEGCASGERKDADGEDEEEHLVDSADMVARGEIESEHVDFTDWRISPLLAPDRLLAHLPPLYFIVHTAFMHTNTLTLQYFILNNCIIS